MRDSSYLLSGTAIFLGSFLLFAIQPIAGKQLLPYFGGSSSVWATSLVFFTAALFVGYLYVYVLAKISHGRQFVIHMCIVAGAVLFALVLLFAPHLVPAVPDAVVDGEPAAKVLLALLFSIGAPYLLLSTTAPLLQYWYGTGTGREPYTLYALSNVASLLALLSYPFVIEPFISLRYQKGIWLLLFFAYAMVYVVSALVFFSTRRSSSETSEGRPKRARVSLMESVLWILLAALPSFTLLAATTHITQTIVPVPLLWIVPLALYLGTFVIAFAGWGQSIFTPLFFFASATVAWWFTPAAYDDIVPQILSYLTLLFFCGFTCHALLYRMRPQTPVLPFFYLLISLGGAIGVLSGSMLAPLVFSDFWDFPLALAVSGAFAAWLLPKPFFPRILESHHITYVKVFFLVLVVSLFLRHLLADQGVPTIATRNFYGSAKVYFQGDTVSLMHGTTLHGMQFANPADARLPTTYFTPGSGVGRAILYEQNVRSDKEVRVGVIGLGTGTIAAYCRPGDMYVFYEIDSRIEGIARSYFSYLSHCEGTEVRIGDGRILLESELSAGTLGAFDVFAVDAFSDDTIPVHLLTLQAFELYASHLRSPESILAVHISSRYLELAPVVFRLAAELGMNAMLVPDSGESSPGGSSSLWVVLSKDSGVFRSVAFANTDSPPPVASSDVWTDDYTSLFSVLSLPRPWE